MQQTLTANTYDQDHVMMCINNMINSIKNLCFHLHTFKTSSFWWKSPIKLWSFNTPSSSNDSINQLTKRLPSCSCPSSFHSFPSPEKFINQGAKVLTWKYTTFIFTQTGNNIFSLHKIQSTNILYFVLSTSELVKYHRKNSSDIEPTVFI